MINFEVWKDSGVGLVEPVGELDMPAVPQLRRAVSEASTLATLPVTVIVDDGQVTFFGPIAFGVLMAEHRRLRALGNCQVQ